jgi:hypothetical protein
MMGIGIAPVELIDALRPVIKQYQDLQFGLYQARLLSSPPNSIVPKRAPAAAQIYSGIRERIETANRNLDFQGR